MEDEVYYLHGDNLGSTSLTTDDAGEVVSEVRYHPYGLERWTAGETPTDFGFTSQRAEKSFGLMDYNARYYSPVLGRFVSPDTIVPEPGSSGGFNRYRYVRNNPIKYTDPSGHFECAGVYDCSIESRSSADVRIFYMNGVRQEAFNNIAPEDMGDEYQSILHTLNESFGSENVHHIPVFNTGYPGGSWEWRLAIWGEAYLWDKPYANRVANTVEQSLDPVPLGPNEKLVLVGSSAGGTAAIEALDILQEKGIFVDHVILRSSAASEWWLSNVGQADYLATNPPSGDWLNYSLDINPIDGIDVQQHVISELTDHAVAASRDAVTAQEAINELIVDLIDGNKR